MILKIEIKKVHIKVFIGAVALWLVMFVAFFIVRWFSQRHLVVYDIFDYPWVPSILNASKYWALVCLLVAIVYSGLKNLKYIILQAVFILIFLTTACLQQYHYRTVEIYEVGLEFITLFISSVIFSLVLRGGRNLWRDVQ